MRGRVAGGQNTNILTFIGLSQFTFPPRQCENPALLQIVASTWYYWPFTYSDSVKCIMASHCGFYFAYSWWLMKLHGFYNYWPVRYSLLWTTWHNFCSFSNIYMYILHIFLYNLLYLSILGMNSLLNMYIINKFSHSLDYLFTVSWDLWINRNYGWF